MRIVDMMRLLHGLRAGVVAALFGSAFGDTTAARPTETVDPVAFVRAAVARGEKTIVVPKGVYTLDTKGRIYFAFRGLKDVTIDFQGGRLNGVRRTRMFDFA